VSFDLAVLSAARPLTADEARRVYLRLCEGDDGATLLAPDERVDEFAREIRARWPDLDDLPEEEVDDSPWSIGVDVSPRHMLVSFVWSRVDDTAPAFVDLAAKHGLYVFDPQENALQLPNGTRTKAMPQPQPELTCTRCGKSIDAAEPRGDDPSTGEVMHLDCMLDSLDERGTAVT
jgi:hypothetical protein